MHCLHKENLKKPKQTKIPKYNHRKNKIKPHHPQKGYINRLPKGLTMLIIQ